MTALKKPYMNVDEYLAWASAQPGKYELIDGVVHAMTPERAVHAEIKLAVHMALAAGITVRIDETTAHEPDALIYCGPKLAASALEVKNPVVVVEVLSPSSKHIDASLKLASYFRLPSVDHYLIVDPDRPRIIHHARRSDGSIATRIVQDGAIALDPPGLELALSDVYGAT